MSESTIIRCSALTHRGRVRARNEDCIHADPASGLVAVADGMGGHNAGDVASRLAIESLVASFGNPALDRRMHSGTGAASDDTDRLARAVADANLKVFAGARSWPGCEGMGTTLSAAWFIPGDPQRVTASRVVVAHVGDSRLYRYESGSLERITRDHTTLQDLIDTGAYPLDQARRLVPRNYLTRALGIEPETPIDVQTRPVSGDDLFLLCSDGLSNMLGDQDLLTLLDRLHEGPLADLAQALIDAANERGGHDNISVVLAALKDIRTTPDA